MTFRPSLLVVGGQGRGKAKARGFPEVRTAEDAARFLLGRRLAVSAAVSQKAPVS